MDNKEAEPTVTALKRKKRLLVGLIAAAIVLLLGVLAYVYWFQAPNRVISDALLDAAHAQSATYTGTLSRSGNTKMVAALDGGISKDGAKLNADFSFDAAGKKYTLEGNGLMDNKGDAYVKVQNIDSLVNNYRRAIPENSQKLFDQIIAKIDDKWIKVSAADIQRYDAGAATVQKCITEVSGRIQIDKTEKTQLVDVYKKHPFVVVDKSLGIKDGSLGYVVSINKSATEAFNAEFKNTDLYKSVSECDTIFNPSGDSPTSTQVPQLQLWISQWTHRITRVTLDNQAGGQTTTFSIKPAFDRPVAIATPKTSTTLQQLQEDVQALLTFSQPAVSTPAP